MSHVSKFQGLQQAAACAVRARAGTAQWAKSGAEATQPLSPDVRLPPESESTPVQFPGRPLASCCCCCCCCCCCRCCCCNLFALRWRERTAGRSRPGTEKRNGRTAVADCKGPTAGRLATCRRRTTDGRPQDGRVACRRLTAGRPSADGRRQKVDCRRRRQRADCRVLTADCKGPTAGRLATCRRRSTDGRPQDGRVACRRPIAGRPSADG